MLRQILARGITETVNEEAEEVSEPKEAGVRIWTDLLMPAGLALLTLILADIAIRRLRWKDVVMFFKRA